MSQSAASAAEAETWKATEETGMQEEISHALVERSEKVEKWKEMATTAGECPRRSGEERGAERRWR
jgi:hypothetical protein